MGNVKEIIELAEKFIERRRPLQVQCHFEGEKPPIFLAVVTNISKAEPVVVKEVRVHFGMTDYNYSFVLMPRQTTTVLPKHEAIYHLSYDGCAVQQRVITKRRPDNIGTGTPPKTPAHLFMAIAKATPNDSWIEVDFNEFTQRKFLKGQIQPVFSHMLVIGRKAMSQPSPAVGDAV